MAWAGRDEEAPTVNLSLRSVVGYAVIIVTACVENH